MREARPAGAPSPIVEVVKLNKAFHRAHGGRVNAIDSTTLTVSAGEFVVLLGPSGCGKTTLLRCVAGLEQPDSGEIRISGRMVYSSTAGIDVQPDQRRLSMIFQSYALWPHMSVLKNVAYPLENTRPRPSRRAMRARVEEVLELVGIPELINQYPNQMSGGQQQRVALARALAGGSTLILFDEPLSNVDAKVREQLRHELASMQRDLGFAALYVTHDQQEAMHLAHRIAVIGAGAVRQLGSPREIYAEPTSRYVANFVGTTNEIHGTVIGRDGQFVEVDTAIGVIRGRSPGVSVRGDAVVALWRPERTSLGASSATRGNSWSGQVQESVYSGTHVEQAIRIRSEVVHRWTADDGDCTAGDEVCVSVRPDDVRVLPADDSDLIATPAEEREDADPAVQPLTVSVPHP